MRKEQSYGCIPVCKKGATLSVFLVRHSHGKHWGFPKGHVEEGETPQETALRELGEETGITSCRFLDTEPFEEVYSFAREGERIEKVVAYFLCIVEGACNMCPIEEIADIQLVPFPEVEMTLTFEEARSVWRRARPVAEEKLKEAVK
jgi:8-oxo-dGTP pyrophosphatase MutT (NUDIX family)